MEMPGSCDAFIREYAWQLLVEYEELPTDRLEMAVELRDEEDDELTTAALRYGVHRTELRDRVVADARRRLWERAPRRAG